MIVLFCLAIINNALNTGMFTIIAYMGIIIFSFFYYGNKTSLLKKVFIVLIGILFMLVLQTTKKTYRQFTWGRDYTENKAVLFIELFTDNLQKGSDLIEMDALFPIYTRTNQGLNVSMVMKRIPAVQDFDEGDRLTTVILSSLVPRFLWPDKPQAGGKFNMLYYAGFRIRDILRMLDRLEKHMEVLGSFGGVIYMILLGLFIRWAYIRVFAVSQKIPLLICWLPVLFFQVIYSNENDTLQILNSLFKSAFFIVILYKFVPFLFKIVESRRKTESETLSAKQAII
jgi:hypothetical protein